MMSRPSVQAALLLLLLVSARAKDTGEDAKMRAQEPKEPGLPPLHARDRRTPEEMEERRKASALFAALIEPKTPKEIQFPLTEEDEAKFHASREGLMEWVVSAARQHDLLNSEVRAQLRDKTKRNQQATREMLVQAVNKGATLQQARVGLIISQFEALPEQAKVDALANSNARRAKMPAGARDKARSRQLAKHEEEKEQLKALSDAGGMDSDRAKWVEERYMPNGQKVPKLLED